MGEAERDDAVGEWPWCGTSEVINCGGKKAAGDVADTGDRGEGSAGGEAGWEADWDWSDMWEAVEAVEEEENEAETKSLGAS